MKFVFILVVVVNFLTNFAWAIGPKRTDIVWTRDGTLVGACSRLQPEAKRLAFGFCKMFGGMAMEPRGIGNVETSRGFNNNGQVTYFQCKQKIEYYCNR